jgi:GNAT superfamily N-acetyltransferase
MKTNSPNPPFSIRPARADDCGTIAELIRELAVYERLEAEAKATPEDIRRDLFGPRPFAEALIAEVDGEPVGFALFFHNYSTIRGRPGIYLEDLFVRPESRGRGIGRALLAHLAKLASERGCGRLEWAVLDWNEPSINFYRSLDALPMDDWTIFRLADGPLARLAESAGEGSGAVVL